MKEEISKWKKRWINYEFLLTSSELLKTISWDKHSK